MKKLLTMAFLFVVTLVAIISFIAPTVFGQESRPANVNPPPAAPPVMTIQLPRLSPDGSQIVFRVLERLWIQSLKGGQARRLVEGGGTESDPIFSPDGSQIVFRSLNRLWLQSLKGGPPRRLVESDEGTESNPAFSPDGRELAFMRRVPGKGQEFQVMEFQSGKTRTVAPMNECGWEQLTWSPNGELISSTHCNAYEIIAIDPIKLTQRVIANTSSSWTPYAQLSADGKTLYFQAKYPGSDAALYRLQMEPAAKPEPLLPVIAQGMNIVLHDQWLAHAVPNQLGIRLAPLTSSGIVQADARVLSEANSREFSFTPNGSALLYVAGNKLWRHPLKGGESTEIPIRLDYAGLIAEINRKRQAVVTWLKDNAIPIKTVEAGNGFQDLQPLKKVFKDVRFVGLGEATHGTREFFQFKHRMLEFLVKEMGFRVFAMEAVGSSACQNLNDYVMGKTDDGAKTLDGLDAAVWNTEEVRAMIDWIRRYNLSVSPDKRVKFADFDVQTHQTGRERLLEYLKRVAPERAAEFEESLKVDLEQLRADSSIPDKQKESKVKMTDFQIKYNILFVFLEINELWLAERSNQAEFEQMREYARVIVQNIDSPSRLNRSLFARDLYSADNFRRLVEREPAGTRFVIWAGNGHLSKRDKDNLQFGYQLRRFYGSDYYALGLGFNQGSFQAREVPPGQTLTASSMLRSFTVNPAPAESIDWFLAQTGVKSFVLDFRSSRKNAEATEWLAAPNIMRRAIGAAYGPHLERYFFMPTTLNKEFDGLFFIDTTTRARPNPSVKNVAPTQ